MSDARGNRPQRERGQALEIERLRGSLARAESRSAYVAARVAGRLGNELADVCVEAGRLADAVAGYLDSSDGREDTLRAALERWTERERARRQR